MDANALCACGSPALRFCTCQPPTKIYLCSDCLTKHVTTPGAHAFFDIKVKDLLDPYLLNVRCISAGQFRARIDQVSELLFRELGTVDEVMDDLYKKHCEELLLKYQKAARGLNDVYQNLINSLDGIRAEIDKLETDLQVNLSAQAKQFCQWCWHVDTSVPTVINQREEISNSVQGQKTVTAGAIFSVWGCRQPQCPLCTNKENELSLSLPSRPEVRQLISCEKCETSMLLNDPKCSWCGWTKAVQGSATQPPNISNPSIWLCPRCEYEYNFLTEKQCTRCQYKREG